MAAKKQNAKIDYGKEILESLEQWKHIREHGAGDPFWSDGVNLNLVRNHVIYYKRMCEEHLKLEEYPEEYYLETPPKVDNNFIVMVEKNIIIQKECSKNADELMDVGNHEKNFR